MGIVRRLSLDNTFAPVAPNPTCLPHFADLNIFGYLKSLAIPIIIVSLIIVIISFCGCYGACCKNKIMLFIVSTPVVFQLSDFTEFDISWSWYSSTARRFVKCSIS